MNERFKKHFNQKTRSTFVLLLIHFRDPCPHARDTTTSEHAITFVRTRFVERRVPSRGSSVPRAAMTSGEREAGPLDIDPWRNQPSRFFGDYPRAAPRAHGPRDWRPSYDVGERQRMGFPQGPRPSPPDDWRFEVLPRRGPPVASIDEAYGGRLKDLREREPRGVTP